MDRLMCPCCSDPHGSTAALAMLLGIVLACILIWWIER